MAKVIRACVRKGRPRNNPIPTLFTVSQLSFGLRYALPSFVPQMSRKAERLLASWGWDSEGLWCKAGLYHAPFFSSLTASSDEEPTEEKG